MRFFYKSSILILLLIATAKSVYSNDTIKYTINWLPPIPSWFSSDSAAEKFLFTFQNAKHNTDGIPVFIEVLPFEENCSDVKIQTISIVFDTVPASEIYSHSENIPDQLSFSSKILKEGKKSFVQISFIPIIRQNDKFLRVKEFTSKLVKTRSFSTKKSSIACWKNESVLSSGTWKKIAITKTAVYKLTFAEIKSLGFSTPAEVRIFGNGGTMLPERYSENQPDDLKELPVYMFQGADGVFNEGDYVLFYATGPVIWEYNATSRKFIHSTHNFTDKVSYFITSGPNRAKIPNSDIISVPHDISVTSFIDYAVHEKNELNLIKSGRLWVGETFAQQPSRIFNFNFPEPVENSPFTIEGEVLARSVSTTAFALKYNNQNLVNQTLSRVYTDDETSNHADLRTFAAKGSLAGKDAAFTLSFDKGGDNSAAGWLNYLRINARRKLYFSDQLMFRDTAALFQSKTALYTIENSNNNLLVWDVSNINRVKNIPYTLSGQQISFKAQTDTLREFIIFDPAKALTPDFLSSENSVVENQNLHALSNQQMVIIAHRSLLTEAEELAKIHRNNDNLSVVTVTPEQIYNEFSSGNPDPAAYRNFMKMLYDKATQPEEMPRYLLLFGDGSYKNHTDNAENTIQKNTNLILTYQSVNSLRPVSSYVSDDYFGMLDDNESIEIGLLDIGIGRFPVSTPAQARAVVNKIKKYISASSSGNWRNNICFVADDEDGNIHMSQADQMSVFLKSNYPVYNQLKLYSDAYPQVITSAGPRYPEVNKAIENTLNRGVLIMNYTGHGGKTGLAHEQIVVHEEIKNWNNTVYPLFITATCEFSRFDDYELTTAGEDVLLNEHGGGIALLSTTRLVYSGPNFVLNQEFFKNFLTKDSSGSYLRLGDILKRTKNSSGNDINKLSFTLLGDPALQLAYPKFNIQTTEINDSAIVSPLDTLKAYKEVTVKGLVTDHSGNKASGFNGTVYPSLYDKEQNVKTLNNDNGGVFSFNQQESLLYKGKATVKNGEFEFSFVVPREIAYNYGNGKLSYYASSNENSDASGFFDKFIIGGISSGAVTDNEGPAINLYLNDKNFINGGIANQFPTLLADLNDDNGINISGTSIGHSIIGTIDNNSATSFVLNNYFESEIDNYKSGTINFKLPKLSPGKHTLSLKAWDIFNNSSLAEIAFEVIDSTSLTIKNLYNYPNPFSESTTFVFEHNQPGKNLETELQIFSITGNKLYSEKMSIMSEGFTSGPILWDGSSINYKKLEKGIYLYRFVLRYNGSEIVSESKKMVVHQ